MRCAAVVLAVAVSACASARPTAATTPPAVAPSPSAAAFVDMDAALTQCREGLAAKEDLKKTWLSYQQQLDHGEEEIIRKRELIRGKRERGLDVSDDEAAVAQELASLQAEYTKLQGELRAAELGRADPIRARLRRIARELASARGIKEVSESAVGHDDGRRWIDLTAEVIRAADAESGRP